jgi:hypothetical protein
MKVRVAFSDYDFHTNTNADLNLPTNGPYDYLNDSAFIEMAVKAEVWIYTGTNFTGTYRHTHTLLDQVSVENCNRE